MCMQKRITHLLKKVVAILSLNEETHYMVSKNITYKISWSNIENILLHENNGFTAKILRTNIYYGKNYPSMHAKWLSKWNVLGLTLMFFKM